MSKDVAETVPIILEEGTYTILVFGYRGTSDIASYKGESEEQKVEVGRTQTVIVSLKGNIVSTAYGTLTYNITLPDDTLAATMKIEPHSISPEGTPSQEINLLTPLSRINSEGIPLKSGYYEVTVTYSGTDAYRENVITWILHIYPNQKSHFECTNLPSLVKTNLTVAFVANGGTPAPEPVTVSAGGTITAPVVTRNNFSFVGWYKEPAFTTLWNFVTDRVWSDITLYANWAENEKFTVTFDKNTTDSVTNMPATITNVYIGAKITEPATKPVRAGYTFGGWYKEAALNNAWDFATDTVTGNIILHAKWMKNPIVIYNGNAPSTADEAVQNVPPPVTVPYDSKLTRPTPSPTLKGHTLYKQNTNDQWYTDPEIFNDETRWSFADNPVTGDMNLYARWTIDTYTATFHANHSGSGWTGTQSALYGAKLTEPTIPTAAMRTGYKLTGWRLDFGFGDEWLFNIHTVKEDINLYAQWEEEEPTEEPPELGRENDVDADADFTVTLGKDAWSHGFRLTINNSVGAQPGSEGFVWKIKAAGGYEYILVEEKGGQLRLQGIGDYSPNTTGKPEKMFPASPPPVWWNTSPQPIGNGPWNGPRYYAEPSMVWLYESGKNPIEIVFEYGERIDGIRPTLTFTIFFKLETTP
jgi:uncharacterized repeat protein (TIGR02543 family)